MNKYLVLILFVSIFSCGEPGRQGIQGKQGIQGIQGIPGIQGEKGEPGKDGINGKNGIDGKDGIPGADGKDGLNGKQGFPGKDGAQGIKGDTGERGLQGLQGERGLQGAKGDKGDKGDPGTNGLKGDKGDRGLPGIKGDRGEQGLQGEKGEPYAPPSVVYTVVNDSTLNGRGGIIVSVYDDENGNGTVEPDVDFYFEKYEVSYGQSVAEIMNTYIKASTYLNIDFDYSLAVKDGDTLPNTYKVEIFIDNNPVFDAFVVSNKSIN